jgi:hypothetical protein
MTAIQTLVMITQWTPALMQTPTGMASLTQSIALKE